MLMLMEFAEMSGTISTMGKPFPLLYEEIFLRYSRDEKGKEMLLKRKIRHFLTHIRTNDLHHRVLDLDVAEVLTTNYDYNLEYAASASKRDTPHIHPVKGNKYSMARRRQARNKVIWHIHGEMDAVGSMLLGYEQYAGYLQHIRNYVTKGIQYKDVNFSSLVRRLKAGNMEVLSWVDHFFHSNVYILGLSLDFVEIHLWWLLAYRARMLGEYPGLIQNKIIYLYPEPDGAIMKPRLDLLCACKVDTLPVAVVDNDWKKMYDLALDFVDCQA